MASFLTDDMRNEILASVSGSESDSQTDTVDLEEPVEQETKETETQVTETVTPVTPKEETQTTPKLKDGSDPTQKTIPYDRLQREIQKRRELERELAELRKPKDAPKTDKDTKGDTTNWVSDFLSDGDAPKDDDPIAALKAEIHQIKLDKYVADLQSRTKQAISERNIVGVTQRDLEEAVYHAIAKEPSLSPDDVLDSLERLAETFRRGYVLESQAPVEKTKLAAPPRPKAQGAASPQSSSKVASPRTVKEAKAAFYKQIESGKLDIA